MDVEIIHGIMVEVEDIRIRGRGGNKNTYNNQSVNARQNAIGDLNE